MIGNPAVLRNRLVAKARLRHLQMFVSVAELGGVTKAALAIGASQPAITQTLVDLESLLECPLFLRHARGMRPTRVGLALLPIAKRILAAVDDGAEQVLAAVENSSDVVRVASIPAAVTGLLVRALPAFQQAHPDVVLQVVGADAQRQAAMVARNEVDVVFCRTPSVVPAEWRYVPLVKDSFFVAAGPGHPLVGRKAVGMGELRAATWMLAPLSTAGRAAYDSLFEKERVPPRTTTVVTDSLEIFEAMLAQQPLLTIVSYSFAHEMLASGRLVEVKVRPRLPAETIGMLLPAVHAPKASLVFGEFMETFARDLERKRPGPAS